MTGPNPLCHQTKRTESNRAYCTPKCGVEGVLTKNVGLLAGLLVNWKSSGFRDLNATYSPLVGWLTEVLPHFRHRSQ